MRARVYVMSERCCLVVAELVVVVGGGGGGGGGRGRGRGLFVFSLLWL